MNNKLPKIFQNNDLNYKTNNTYAYGTDKKDIKKGDVRKQLKSIFSSNRHIRGVDVEITINNTVKNETIIAKTSDYLITKENNNIYIKDIQNIVEK